MNFFKLLKLSNLFFKLAAQDAYTISSIDEAKSILDISAQDYLTEDLINKKYKKLVLIHHPDVGGSNSAFAKITAAKNYLINNLNVKPDFFTQNTNFDRDYYDNLSYEQIAEMRQKIGREAFDKKFPGWLSELKSEMGLDEFNKIFEKYDPNNQGEDDLDRMHQRDLMYQVASDIIYDSFDLADFEELLVKLTNEEKLFLLNNLNNSKELLNILLNLGRDESAHIDYSNKIDNAIKSNSYILEYLSASELEKIKSNIIFEKLKKFLELHKYDFAEILSLEDIIESNNLFFLFDKGLHLRASEVNKVFNKDFFKFLKGQAAVRARSIDIENYTSRRQNHYLADMFSLFKKQDDINIPVTEFLVTTIFGGILEKFPNLHQSMIEFANPANYRN